MPTLDHALIVDFVNAGRPVSERVALELSVTSARELVASMQAALDAFVEVSGVPRSARL